MKIWHRYLFGRLIKTFLFLLVCLFTIYVIVDLSVHGVRFLSNAATTFADISLFYLRSFAKHLELFMPLTLLLSSLKVLIDLNGHHELVALQMAGLSRKTLLRPFFAFAAILTFACYANSQWLAPEAQDAADAFRSQHSKKKKKIKREKVYNIPLDDDSELIYQSFDEKKKELFDVFWVKSESDIWHMKYLRVDPKRLAGRFVDHLQRNERGQFEKLESYDRKEFPDLVWNDNANLERFVPFENRPLFTLLRQAAALTADRQSIFCHLHYKIAVPLLPFFILIAISPIAMRFTRTRPTFLIVAVSLLTFVALMTIIDGMLILGENQVIPSYLAIWGPIALLFAISVPRFAKM
jgi:lipopolysaccharide export LptBFGC system permease protein LptF